MKRVTPEEIEGVRRLLAERPLGGLRPVEIPRAVLDRLAQALFDLAELQEASGALLAALNDPQGDLMVYCSCEIGDDLICGRVGTRCDDDVVRCDEHAWPRLEELSYAPAWRRWLALVEKP